MRLTVFDFQGLIMQKVKNNGGVNHKNAYKSVVSIYCDEYFCPGNCSICAPDLIKVLELSGTKNPGGALRYRLKQLHVNKTYERSREKERMAIEQSLQPNPGKDDGNPFNLNDLLKQIEASANTEDIDSSVSRNDK